MEVDPIVRMRAQWAEEEEERKWRLEREQNVRDRGIGYLVYLARMHARIGQRALARKLNTNRSVLSRIENGHQLPNIYTLQRIAQETGLELVVGWREPDAHPEEFVALAAVEDEGRMTELRMLKDRLRGRYVRPVTWRQKHGYEETGFSDLIREEEVLPERLRRRG